MMKRQQAWSVLLLLVVVLCTAWGPMSSRWYTYEKCSLIDNAFNDGDSFHVKTKSNHYVFRIYFADAPETDDSIAERVEEQARHWDISTEDVIRVGREAKRFTAKFLRNGFTAYSRRADARGRGKQERFFAMIKVGDQYLSEALVAAGLARVYGADCTLPDGTSRRKYWAKLHALERTAQRNKVGAWGVDTKSSRQPEDEGIKTGERVLARPLGIYTLKSPARLIGILQRGARITVLSEEKDADGMVRVSFDDKDSQGEGRCRATSLTQ